MSRITREHIVIVILLCISLAINIPGFIRDKKEYDRVRALKAQEAVNLQTSDEWRVSTPGEQGMDEGLVKKADEVMDRTDALSFIAVRHGTIVFEKYYNSSAANNFNVFSVTKSFMSSLIGIAIDKGLIKGTDQKIADYFPEYSEAWKDEARRAITLKHLLTMTPGFLEDLNAMYGSSDWADYILKLPIKYKPGEKYQYANASSHLLSVILSKASGMSTQEFAEKNLFTPLGIAKKQWMKDSKGYNAGNANLFLRPRDMAKFGLLYLNRGKWNGNQVVSAAWVEESTKKHVSKSDKQLNNEFDGYGYQWHIAKAGQFPAYHAAGYGGQYICIVPELDVVVVMTSIPDRQFSVNDEVRRSIMDDFIVPSVKK